MDRPIYWSVIVINNLHNKLNNDSLKIGGVMNKCLCYFFFIVNPLICMQSEVKEIDEVFTPIEDRNIILDINDPEVQAIIKKVVSASIHEAFQNKQLEKEIANKKRCCNSSTKLKIALLTALSSTATAIITIALNNQ